MFKTVQHHLWAFDLEWVPDPQAGRVLYKLPAEMPDVEVVAEMWKRNGATEEDPFPFLKTVMCRVVSIAAVQRRVKNGQTELNLLWLPRDPADAAQNSEAAMLSTFLQAVGKHKPQMVGFNSQASDLKILVQRGVVLGLEAPDFCRRPDKPWEGPDYFGRGSEFNIDLMDILGTWGKGALSLNEIAALSGIPGKFETDGQQVAPLWLAGQWKPIVEYNCFDALTTYLVWLRTAHFAGHFTREQYQAEQDLVRDLLIDKSNEPDGEYLEKYADEWERLLAATGQS